jgi:RNA polymerase sigma factor (sigma-70 family)
VDEETFERLYREHCDSVRAYVRRRQPPDEVDEALADIWLVAWRRRRSLPAAPLPWLYGTARRVLANQRRSGRRRLALAARLTDAASEPPALTDRELGSALARLAPDDREALLLTAWEGLDATAAADAMGCSLAAFQSRLRRARQRLQRELTYVRAISPQATELEVGT